MSDAAAAEPKVSSATALYLALLQFLFNLCWALSGTALVGLAVNWARRAVAVGAAT
jgi:hypothetical protein